MYIYIYICIYIYITLIQQHTLVVINIMAWNTQISCTYTMYICILEARTFQTVLKVNPRNSRPGSKLTSHFYMKCLFQICPT